MSYYPDDSLLMDPDDAFDGDQGASELLGKLSRSQWEDWKKRYSSYIDKVANLASDSGYADQQARQSSDAVGLAYGRAQDAQQMQQQGLGLSRSTRQQQSNDRQLGAAKAAAQVDSANQTRVAAHDLQSQLLAGGMGLQKLPQGMN